MSQQKTRLRFAVLSCALFASACNASDGVTSPDQPLLMGQTVPSGSAAENEEVLADVVWTYLRGAYTVTDVEYRTVAADIPWVAVAKNLSNQMAEAGRKKEIPQWHRAGKDLIDLYPSGDSAFAVAMLHDPLPDGQRLIGYFTLRPSGE